jgi:hypothetical protein
VLVKKVLREAVILIRVILCLLSTRLGTLLLCGRLSLCGKGPFIFKFKDMPLERREEVLKRWSRAQFLFLLRVGFLVVKILTNFIFYSYVSSFIYIFFFKIPEITWYRLALLFFFKRSDLIIISSHWCSSIYLFMYKFKNTNR